MDFQSQAFIILSNVFPASIAEEFLPEHLKGPVWLLRAEDMETDRPRHQIRKLEPGGHDLFV